MLIAYLGADFWCYVQQCDIHFMFLFFFISLSLDSCAPFSNWIIDFIGKVAMEGKVEHKFDMKPHEENIEEYGRLCRERTNKSMIKNRQIQVGNLVVHFLFHFCSFRIMILFFGWMSTRWLIMTEECTWDPCLEWLAWFHPTQRYWYFLFSFYVVP